MSSGTPASREIAFDVAALTLLRFALSIAAIRAGFVSVSDDDFSRTVIAEAFAHAPKLDPSGTSWLPFPFWITGAAMMFFGRTLAVAKLVSWTLGAIGMGALYVTLRAAPLSRVAASFAVLLTLLLPWNLWLGVAAVPETFSAYFTAVAIVAAARMEAPMPPYALLLLGAAALSRYEVWPVCLVVALMELAKAVRNPLFRRHLTATACFALAGPLLWLLWNRVSHGDFFHSLQRVARFRHAIGADSGSAFEKAVYFPRLLVTGETALVALAALSLTFAIVRGAPIAGSRFRWGTVLAALVSILAFLSYGNMRDGSPTHHPERALLPALFLCCVLLADAGNIAVRAITRAKSAREAWAFAFVVFGTVVAFRTTLYALRSPPGKGVHEDRSAQIARGIALRGDHPRHVSLEPCAFEHFALIAAFGAPELVEVRPASGNPVGPNCPRVLLSE